MIRMTRTNAMTVSLMDEFPKVYQRFVLHTGHVSKHLCSKFYPDGRVLRWPGLRVGRLHAGDADDAHKGNGRVLGGRDAVVGERENCFQIPNPRGELQTKITTQRSRESLIATRRRKILLHKVHILKHWCSKFHADGRVLHRYRRCLRA